MFKIFTFKQLMIISFFLCLIMLLGEYMHQIDNTIDITITNTTEATGLKSILFVSL